MIAFHVNSAGEIKVLLQQRGSRMRGSNALKVALPGGHVEDRDRKPSETALREATEETDIDFWSYYAADGPSGHLVTVLPGTGDHWDVAVDCIDTWDSNKCSRQSVFRSTVHECANGFSRDASRHRWVDLEEIFSNPNGLKRETDRKPCMMWRFARRSINALLDYYESQSDARFSQFFGRRLPKHMDGDHDAVDRDHGHAHRHHGRHHGGCHRCGPHCTRCRHCGHHRCRC